jgi:hypothetical protein
VLTATQFHPGPGGERRRPESFPNQGSFPSSSSCSSLAWLRKVVSAAALLGRISACSPWSSKSNNFLFQEIKKWIFATN